MCSIFGTTIGNKGIIQLLGLAGEARGTDATGLGILKEDGNILINKSDDRAGEFDWENIEYEGRFFQGHTRATTQGNEGDNYNNHPFISPEGDFSLTHNGIIYNDTGIRNSFDLPETKIETDTYVAVQLLQHFKEANDEDELTTEVVQQACEEMRGSFALSIMTEDKLFLLRHSNPLWVINNGEDMMYASTPEMLNTTTSEGNPEVYFGALAGQIAEDTVYAIDLDTLEVVNKAEFEAKSYSTKTTTYGSYGRNYGYSKKSKKNSTTTTTTTSKSSSTTSHSNTSNSSDKDSSSTEEVDLGRVELSREDLENLYDDYYTFLSEDQWRAELDALEFELGLTTNEINTLDDIRDDKIAEEAQKEVDSLNQDESKSQVPVKQVN